MAPGAGAGLSQLHFRPRRIVCSVAIALILWRVSPSLLSESREQKCLALLALIVSMWVSEAAPFEATALLVPPMAVVLGVLEGERSEAAKALLNCVFSDSLYVVLAGFVITSIFARCQLDSRAASALQQLLGDKPFLFMLAVMYLGLFLSALLSNVTAPLLLIEVLKPLLLDQPTDSR